MRPLRSFEATESARGCLTSSCRKLRIASNTIHQKKRKNFCAFFYMKYDLQLTFKQLCCNHVGHVCCYCGTQVVCTKSALETFSSENSFCLKIEVDFLYLKGGLNCPLYDLIARLFLFSMM